MQQLLTMGLGLLIFFHSGISDVAAQSLRPAEKEKLILEQIESGISKDYKVNFTWSTQKESTPDQDISPVPEPTFKTDVVVKPKVTPKVKPVVKKMTRGESKVAEMLRKQREKIKKMRQEQKARYRNDVANQKSGIPEKDWTKRKARRSSDWMQKKVNEQNEWQQKKLEVLNRWAQENLHFKKELPKLKEDLTELDKVRKEDMGSAQIPATGFLKNKIKKSRQRKKSSNSLQVALIGEDFKLPIRSQGRRSTCAAFAAVRAMEILAQRKGNKLDLSEQYFYYASKPRCQSSPCSKKGSWPEPGFKFDIPTEQSCPYSPVEEGHNETQIPMNSGCNNGRAKVSRYERIKGRHELQEAIKMGYPVIGGFKLNEAFYNNKGFVFRNAHNSSAKLDKHAAGHALLLIGVLDLPKELWIKEGKHCTLVANSWGEGWGLGGYACLSDRWFDHYRYPFDFLVIEDVALN